ncbi:TFIIA-alpha and beta-like factor isoform X2 [Mesocricetus auratus]|uniref:TFIIA-alpha and beta-like factor isoform X2 n=1 Tax=Mesocricetus auratus TaxID=10036 RepID=A0A1U7QQW8_MESAU|nr:TFIIA-alpha and beta-like factor isoform X2 [Mesocricetus auratus]
MAFVNLVPKLYRSVIEDVIEGVRDLFAEEGIEEQVLKDLKKLWETKVLQSKATEDFFRNSVHSPLLTLQLPHGLPTLQSTAALLIPAGRPLPSFTPEDLNTSSCGASFTFPGYPVHVPAGVTLQTTSGHLYKVNVPVMVTQTSGRPDVFQHPFPQVLQQLGPPSMVQSSIPPLHPCSLQATPEKSHRMEPLLLQPTIVHAAPVDRKPLDNATTERRSLPASEPKTLPETLLRPQDNPQYISLPGVGFAPHVTLTEPGLEPVLGVSANMTQNLHGGPFPPGPQGPLHHHMLDTQLQGLKDRMYGYDPTKQPRKTEEPSSLPASEKSSASERDLNIQVADHDINEIIQIDGTGDNSSTEEGGSIRDVDENEFPGIADASDLKVLEEEADSVSNEDSTANSSDNEDHQIDTMEEDPLNSGDDVSEQDVPDLFDTDNVIVCQYDKIHRSKNRWKFYLKDGVMCFGGRDYVFAKAIGEAEW